MLYYSLILLPTIVHAVYAQLRNNHCYSCTTIDAGRLLSNIEDLNWRRWLDKIRYIPHIEECNDHFVPEIALRSGARSQECDHGVCMKMWFKEWNGDSQIWRGCIPYALEQIRANCTRITSSEGDMEICTCDSNLCNASVSIFSDLRYCLTFFMLILIFTHFNVNFS